MSSWRAARASWTAWSFRTHPSTTSWQRPATAAHSHRDGQPQALRRRGLGSPLDVEAIHPDRFVLDLLDLAPEVQRLMAMDGVS